MPTSEVVIFFIPNIVNSKPPLKKFIFFGGIKAK